jgi:hypothetical protein
MTEAKQALRDGLCDLIAQLGEQFTVDGFPDRPLWGFAEQTSKGNTLGEGGFLPEGDCVLIVQDSEFCRLGRKPHEQMQIVLRGGAWNVTRVETSKHKYRLSMEFAHPRASSIPTEPYTLHYGTSEAGALTDFEDIGDKYAHGDRLTEFKFTGDGFGFFAVPQWITAPSKCESMDGYPINLAGINEGYGQTTNDLPHALLTVGGKIFRVYRTMEPIASDLIVRLAP